MSSVEALEFFLAAVRAVAPKVLGPKIGLPALGSGAQLIDWVVRAHPTAATILAPLSESERAEVRQVLDGMLRERDVAGAS